MYINYTTLHPSETSVTIYQSSTATTASNRGTFIAELIRVKLRFSYEFKGQTLHKVEEGLG